MTNTLVDVLSLALAVTAGLMWFGVESILGLRAWKRVVGIGLAYTIGILSGVLFVGYHYEWQMGGVFALIGALFLPLLLLVYALRLWMIRGMLSFTESRSAKHPTGAFRGFRDRAIKLDRQYLGRDPVPPEAIRERHLALTALVFSAIVVGTVVGGYLGLKQSPITSGLCFVSLSALYFLSAKKLDLPTGMSKWVVYWAFATVWLVMFIAMVSMATLP